MSMPHLLLKACPHYKATSLAYASDGEPRRVHPTTCSGCGGDLRTGPSCRCPEFGEDEEDDA